jgi:hypothetical protein
MRGLFGKNWWWQKNWRQRSLHRQARAAAGDEQNFSKPRVDFRRAKVSHLAWKWGLRRQTLRSAKAGQTAPKRGGEHETTARGIRHAQRTIARPSATRSTRNPITRKNGAASRLPFVTRAVER